MNLLLISGFPEETCIKELKNLIENYFIDYVVTDIWKDPNREPRAVVLFEKTIDLTQILSCHYMEWKTKGLAVTLEKPTANIFVRTYDAKTYGLIDKLSYLFAKHLISKVHSAKKVEDSCFEFTLKDWNAVRSVCNMQWIIGSTKLTVCPYFDGFKDVFEDQYESLRQQNKDDMTKVDQSSETVEKSDITTQQKSLNEQWQSVPHDLYSVQKSSKETETYVVFSNSILSEILALLNIKDALKRFNCTFIQEDNSGKIIGQNSIVRKLRYMFTDEDTKVKALLDSLTPEKATDINKLIFEKKYSLIVTEMDNGFSMEVLENNDKKAPFQNFVSALINEANSDVLSSSINHLNVVDSLQHFDNKFHKNLQMNQQLTIKIKIEPFFLWIIKQLNLTQALEIASEGYSAEFDFSNNELSVYGSNKCSTALSYFEEMCKEVSFTEEEMEFLNENLVRDKIKEIIDDNELKFIIKKETDIVFWIETHSQKQMKWNEFLTNLIVQKCIPFIKKMQHCPAVFHFLDDFKRKNPLIYLMVDEYKFKLMHISEEGFVREKLNEIETYILVKIEELNYQSIMDTNETYKQPPDQSQEQVFQLDQYRSEFCKMHMIEYLHNISGVIKLEWVDYDLKVYLKPGYSIIGTVKNAITSIKLQSLPFNICGLTDFVQLEQGKQLIEKISQSTRCKICVPLRTELSTNQYKIGNTESLEYKVIFLHTAKCKDCNIHLLQGQIEDLDVQFSFRLLPSQEVNDVTLKSDGSNLHLDLLIPEWSLIEHDLEYLQKLRKSFKQNVALIFKQALYCKKYQIAVTMEGIFDVKHPFPLDLIAKTILKVLFVEVLDSYSDKGATSFLPDLDIYICEPKHESVFKAFQYYIKRYGFFGPPDEEKWNQLCHPKTNKFVSYSQNVEVVSSIPYYEKASNALFCYPISPSLNASTSPLYEEPDVSKYILEESLKKLEENIGEGDFLNGCFQVACFSGLIKRDVKLYCCPEWGPDSAQAIFESLENCLIAASNKSVVYIVPQGIHTSSWYPLRYLAYAVFKALDELLKVGRYSNGLKIVFVIGDRDYNMAFLEELAKRYPKKQSSFSFTSYFKWAFGSSGSTTKNESSVKSALVEETCVTFVYQEPDNVSKAERELKSTLEELLDINAEYINLTKDDLTIFQERFAKNWHYPVSFELTNTKDRNQSKASQVLKLRGLNKHWVLDHKNKIEKTLEKARINSASNIKASTSVDVVVDKSNKAGNKKNSFDKSDLQDKAAMNLKSDKTNLRPDAKPFTPKLEAKEIPNKSVEKHNHEAEGTELQQTFSWMCEKQKDNFEEFNKKFSDTLENIYVSSNGFHHGFKKGDYKHINFDKMMIKKGKTDKKIIRSEVFKYDAAISFPEDWHDVENEMLKDVTTETSPKINSLMKILELELNLKEFDITILQACFKPLYERYQFKKKTLENKNLQFLWHRVCEGKVKNICVYGFHKIFSAMPVAYSELGLGVAFSSNIKDCFTNNSLKDSEICLCYAEVITGDSGPPGGKNVRMPPKDQKTGQKCHSVQNNNIYMIFSDAQAYPFYFVNLKRKK